VGQIQKGSATEIDLDPRLVKAMGHPIRVDVLRIYGERVASPSEVAKQLSQPLNKISHHTKFLLDLGLIELVDTSQVRGAVKHRYRATQRACLTDAMAARLPRSVREAMADMSFGSIFERVAAAVHAGTVDSRTDRHLSWQYLRLDDQGWDELIALKAAQLDAEVAIEAAAVSRLSSGEGEEINVFTSAMAFEAPVVE
jgi:DNA-binding transcriptional ArsR family regulator